VDGATDVDAEEIAASNRELIRLRESPVWTSPGSDDTV
jgi:hypothetical protein